MRSAWRTTLGRLLALAKRSRLDDQLAEEIDLHIELRRQTLVEAG